MASSARRGPAAMCPTFPRRRLASSAFAGSEDRCSHTTPVDNPRIADRLDAFAALLELADANPYSARVSPRGGDDPRRGRPSGRARAVWACSRAAGIGPRIAARLGELVETGEIAELAELERELAPDLIGLGRYLGLSAKRTLEIARALDLHKRRRASGGRGRRPAAARARGRSEDRVAPSRGLAREGEPRPRRALLLHRAAELVGGVASALGGEPAGDVRRWRDSLRAAGGGLCGVGSARRARALRGPASGGGAGRAGRPPRGGGHGRRRADRARGHRA